VIGQMLYAWNRCGQTVPLQPGWTPDLLGPRPPPPDGCAQPDLAATLAAVTRSNRRQAAFLADTAHCWARTTPTRFMPGRGSRREGRLGLAATGTL